ncbi:restriction endonuclease subunit S [Weissella paramesenteroides]|uniref:restriction endonuclease subunit S n=1 Tax=Weissella paramesenteroides TaxID=1249 RepID=UPI001F624DEA|nr:restriction endonuclease subunit S [Weissella paramesenteroides]
MGDNIIQYNEHTIENNQYPVFTSSRKGLFFQKDYYDGHQIASVDNTGYNIVPKGYFTYRHMSDDLIFKFNINDLADYGIVSTLYPVFTTTENLDAMYLMYQLNEGTEFKRFSLLQKQGGSRTYMYFSKLKELKLTIPNIKEQKSISELFKQLDSLITVNQDRILILQKSSIFKLTL